MFGGTLLIFILRMTSFPKAHCLELSFSLGDLVLGVTWCQQIFDAPSYGTHCSFIASSGCNLRKTSNLLNQKPRSNLERKRLTGFIVLAGKRAEGLSIARIHKRQHFYMGISNLSLYFMNCTQRCICREIHGHFWKQLIKHAIYMKTIYCRTLSGHPKCTCNFLAF